MRWGDKICRQCGVDVNGGCPDIARGHVALPIDQASQPFDALGNGFDGALTLGVYAIDVGLQHPADVAEQRPAPSRKGLPT
jgi:hypothetical protein